MSEQNVEVVALTMPEALQEAVELQKVYWGDNMSDIVPLHMLLSIANYGGHVLGALVDGRLVGLLTGFLGADIQVGDNQSAHERLCVMSKRMVVLPEYRNLKIGEKLKWAQRDFALRHDIQLVSWTFDPLLSRNAYLNLHKLRAVGQAYVQDYFGANASNPALSADRLVVNWWVRHAHVTASLPSDYPQAQPANTIQSDAPVAFNIADGETQLLQIPADFLAMEREDAGLAKAWRDHIREAFTQLLGAGYLVTDVLRRSDKTYYVFTSDDHSYTFQKD